MLKLEVRIFMWLNLSLTLLLPGIKKRELSLYGTLGRKIVFLVAQTLDKLGEKARDNGELKKKKFIRIWSAHFIKL